MVALGPSAFVKTILGFSTLLRVVLPKAGKERYPSPYNKPAKY